MEVVSHSSARRSRRALSRLVQSVGDRIEAGDNLFDVETDKASMEVPPRHGNIDRNSRSGR